MPPESTTLIEHSYYVGNYISGILYGIALALYFHTISAALRKGNASTPRNRLFVVVFSTLLLLFLTIDISVNAVWGEEMWITFRNRPGGVAGFLETRENVWYRVLATTASILLIFMGDALLIYRLFRVWGGGYLIVVLPILAYLAAFSMAVAEIIAGAPFGDFKLRVLLDFGIPYYTITITLNIVLTLLICTRLHLRTRGISKILGPENAKVYTGLMAMMIESAAPYTASGIMMLITYLLEMYVLKTPIFMVFWQIWTTMSCISPQWIILRVAVGRAYDQDTIDQRATQLSFVHTNISKVSQMEHHDGAGLAA